MDQEALLTAVRGQPNQTLITNLAKGSEPLIELDRSFSGIGSVHRMNFNWAYETVETRTITVGPRILPLLLIKHIDIQNLRDETMTPSSEKDHGLF